MSASNVIPISEEVLASLPQFGGGDEDEEGNALVYVVVATTDMGDFLRGVFTDLETAQKALQISMDEETTENVNVHRVELDCLVGIVL